jgi:two-component system, LytTR family, response regulator LytT
MNVLLVEDEPLAQQRISSVLAKNFPDWKILDTAQSIKEFKNAWSSYPNIDLVLCDIHLADGLSFKAFEGKKIDVPVIFITAYDQYALQSFDHNCIDYVLKPIDENRLVRACQKAQQFKASPISPEFISGFLANYVQKSYKKRFLTKLGNRFSFVLADHVSYFYSEGGVTFLVENGSAQRQLIDYTLNELECELLDPMKYYRVNRSMIINLESLVEIKPYFNGRLVLSMNSKSDDLIVVARERVNEFKNWINQ